MSIYRPGVELDTSCEESVIADHRATRGPLTFRGE